MNFVVWAILNLSGLPARSNAVFRRFTSNPNRGCLREGSEALGIPF